MTRTNPLYLQQLFLFVIKLSITLSLLKTTDQRAPLLLPRSLILFPYFQNILDVSYEKYDMTKQKGLKLKTWYVLRYGYSAFNRTERLLVDLDIDNLGDEDAVN